jgi:hypothetical protein
MYSFFFEVESFPSHPVYGEGRTAMAWVTVILKDPEEGSEAAARERLKEVHWRAGERKGGGELSPLDMISFPSEAIVALQNHGLYVEIRRAITDFGKEMTENPPWLREDA